MATVAPGSSPAPSKKVEAFHRRCHRRIIAEICEDLSEEEREELLRTMTRINSYFQTKL